MALTDKKRRFAAARRGGASNKEAAIAAGYSAKTAAQAGARLAKDKDVLAAIARSDQAAQTIEAAKQNGQTVDVSSLSRLYSDPADFLKAVMNDSAQEPKLRVDAAKTLMPFTHQKMGEGGKKDAVRGKAAQAAGTSRFASAPPPRLAASGGKKV